jgi:Arc/MetJ-type ribon-helix-helix transcriptional regulator
MAEKDVRITFRVPTTLRDLVKQYISLDAHMNESDFYRDAAREKIQKDAPELYRKLFKINEAEAQDPSVKRTLTF